MKKGLFVLLFFLFISPHYVYAEVTWSETTPLGVSTAVNWTPSSISESGQTMIVGGQNARLYLSTNKGVSWTETQPAGNQAYTWYITSISSDGQTILAGGYNARLFITTNGGTNWSETRPEGDSGYAWYTSSMSSNGQIILVGYQGSGKLFVSTNGGTDWNEVQPAGAATFAWTASAMSADGQKMIVAADGGRVYLSNNAGSSWTEVQPKGDTTASWLSAGMSDNGQIVLVGSHHDRMYLSTDGGSNWSETQPAGNTSKIWYLSGVSSNGKTMYTINGERVYTSSDTGTTWTETRPIGDVSKNWVLGSMSKDSQYFLAGIYGGELYTGINPLPTPTPSLNGNVNSQQDYSPHAPPCTDILPHGVPSLFQIDTAGTYANIYFTAVKGSSGYTVTYGTDKSSAQYADTFDYSGADWVIGRTIGSLAPNTRYYFKVQAKNGCNAGGWSNVLDSKTRGLFSTINEWFSNLFSTHKHESSLQCTYTIQKGDTLWSIASRKWGSGTTYTKLLNLNPSLLQQSLIRSGQKITICE